MNSLIKNKLNQFGVLTANDQYVFVEMLVKDLFSSSQEENQKKIIELEKHNNFKLLLDNKYFEIVFFRKLNSSLLNNVLYNINLPKNNDLSNNELLIEYKVLQKIHLNGIENIDVLLKDINVDIIVKDYIKNKIFNHFLEKYQTTKDITIIKNLLNKDYVTTIDNITNEFIDTVLNNNLLQNVLEKISNDKLSLHFLGMAKEKVFNEYNKSALLNFLSMKLDKLINNEKDEHYTFSIFTNIFKAYSTNISISNEISELIVKNFNKLNKKIKINKGSDCLTEVIKQKHSICLISFIKNDNFLKNLINEKITIEYPLYEKEYSFLEFFNENLILNLNLEIFLNFYDKKMFEILSKNEKNYLNNIVFNRLLNTRFEEKYNLLDKIKVIPDDVIINFCEKIKEKNIEYEKEKNVFTKNIKEIYEKCKINKQLNFDKKENKNINKLKI